MILITVEGTEKWICLRISSDISHGYNLLDSNKFDKMYQEEKKISCPFIQGPFSGDEEDKGMENPYAPGQS